MAVIRQSIWNYLQYYCLLNTRPQWSWQFWRNKWFCQYRCWGQSCETAQGIQHWNYRLLVWRRVVWQTQHKAVATLKPEPTQLNSQDRLQIRKHKHITVYVSGNTETDTTGMLFLSTVWRQQSEFVSSRQSGQTLAAVRIGLECRYNGQNGCRFKCSYTFLQCIPIQMLVCCVVSVLAPM
jgi:hypothetical protein